MKKLIKVIGLSGLLSTALFGGDLHKAASSGNIEVLEKMLKNGVEVNSKTSKGLTALSWAALTDQYDVAALLIRYGADINTKAEKDENRTPLHYAAKEGHIKMVGLLIAGGAQVLAVDTSNYTALQYARFFKNKVLFNAELREKYNEVIDLLQKAEDQARNSN